MPVDLLMRRARPGLFLLLAACGTLTPPAKIAAPAPAPVAVASAPLPVPSAQVILPAAPATPPLTAPAPAAVQTPPFKQPPKVVRKPIIALALGGGAAKGFAHVGVIRALEQNGIVPDIITGTSAGAVVGAIYASGISGDTLRRRALNLKADDLKDFTLSGNAFLKGEKLGEFINREVGRKRIEQLPRRFAAIATDFDSGQRVVLRSGDTGSAVRASAAIPNVFQPVTIRGRRLVDGGLVSPVPVMAAREMGADIVIAVDITAKPARRQSGLIGNLNQSLSIMTQAALAQELRQADVTLHPRVQSMGAADFELRSHAMREGEKVGRGGMMAIRNSIERWQKRQR